MSVDPTATLKQNIEESKEGKIKVETFRKPSMDEEESDEEQ